MNTEERLDLFQGMIMCCHDLYFWTYHADLELLSSNCPEKDTASELFIRGGVGDTLLRYAQLYTEPILMTGDVGNMWVAVPEKGEDDSLLFIHVLGPFFIDDISSSEIDAALSKAKLPPVIRRNVSRFLRNLPVVPLNRIYEYAIMLYYCLTGRKISVSDLHYHEPGARRTRTGVDFQMADTHGTYEMEQEMLRMVREGNLDFQKHMNKLALTGNLGKLSSGTPSRQMKNATLASIVLFSRAAIEGGLSPEVAMTLADYYFQSVEACRSLKELNEIATAMQHNFVERVHRCRTSALSKPVLECCDYIHMHLEEDLSLQQIAEKLRYSEYYLSHKFKQETGVTFREYIRRKKLEQAQTLLADSSLTIREISEKLRFCSQSYFAENFRDVYGVSPTQWREQRNT